MTRTTSKPIFPAILCTIVFSATCVLSAVGPAMSGAPVATAEARPGVAPLA